MDNNHVDERPVATREVHHENGGAAGRGTSAVAWIALLLSLLALALAWTAFDRTGDQLEQRIQEGVTNATQTLDAGIDGVDDDDTDTAPTMTQ